MSHDVAIYARTSPDCPVSAEDQVDRLRTIADERGWTVVACFKDIPSTMKKGKSRRPGEAALLEAIRRGGFQRVLIWDLDRYGRSLGDLVGLLEACREAGVALRIEARQLDSDTSNGMSLFDVGRMMAHHLRQSRRERILAGLSAARANSVRVGRPPISNAKAEKAKEYLRAGASLRRAARASGISAAAVSRLKSTMERELVAAGS